MTQPFDPPASQDLGPVVRAFMMKGIRHDGPVKAGLQWAMARRGRVVFRERGLECWDWSIPYEDVERAWVEWYRSSLGQAPVLQIQTRAGVQYQFGMNPSAFWKAPELPLQVEVTDVVHGSAVRVWLVRILLLALVISFIAWAVLQVVLP